MNRVVLPLLTCIAANRGPTLRDRHHHCSWVRVGGRGRSHPPHKRQQMDRARDTEHSPGCPAAAFVQKQPARVVLAQPRPAIDSHAFLLKAPHERPLLTANSAQSAAPARNAGGADGSVPVKVPMEGSVGVEGEARTVLTASLGPPTTRQRWHRSSAERRPRAPQPGASVKFKPCLTSSTSTCCNYRCNEEA